MGWAAPGHREINYFVFPSESVRKLPESAVRASCGVMRIGIAVLAAA